MTRRQCVLSLRGAWAGLSGASRTARAVFLLASLCSSACVRNEGRRADALGPNAQSIESAGQGEAGKDLALQRCAVLETSRSPLMVAGSRKLYVEPTVMSASDGYLLLAGKPTYMFEERADGTARLESSADVFGAMVAPDGSTTVIPSPIPSALLKPLAALSQRGRQWGVVFAEYPPRPDTGSWFYSDSTIHRLWYSTYDGNRWLALEELPLPPVRRLSLHEASPVIGYGDTIMWAIPAVPRAGSRYAAVFQKVGSTWSHSAVGGHLTHYPVDLTLARSPRLGFVLALVQPDPAMSRDINSLFFYVRREHWSLLRKVVSGLGKPVFHPSLVFGHESRDFLTWMTRGDSVAAGNEARAMLGDLAHSNGPTIVVDPGLIDKVFPLELRSPEPIWISSHVEDDGVSLTVRLTHAVGGRISELWSVVNPYTGFFGAAATGPTTVTVSGPLLDRERQLLYTLLLNLRVECGAPQELPR